jgi:NTE family protein
MTNWQSALIDWRCKLSAAERHRYGAPPGWNCRDVRISVGRIAFDQLDPRRAAALNAVETSFNLPPEEVDMVISAGHDAVKNSSVFRAFVASLGGAPRPPSLPLPAPGAGPQSSSPQSSSPQGVSTSASVQ